MTKITISFLIGVGIYLAVIGIVCLVKYLRAKKQYEKDKEDKGVVVNEKEKE